MLQETRTALYTPAIAGQLRPSSAASQALFRIQELGDTLLHARQRLPSLMNLDHKSEYFKEEVIPVVKGIARLRDESRPLIRSAAKQITGLHPGEGWNKEPEIVALWYVLARGLKPLSDHPRDDPEKGKWVAAVIVRQNRLIGYGVNQVPNGLPRDPVHYVEGIRRDLIACAERIAIADVLNVRIHPKAKSQIKRACLDNHLPMARGYLEKFNGDIVVEAIKAQKDPRIGLKGATLLVILPSCEDCQKPVQACDFEEIFMDPSAGAHFSRASELVGPYEKPWGRGTELKDVRPFLGALRII